MSLFKQVLLNTTKESKAKAGISEFNELRKAYKQPITFQELDLSNKSLSGVNLNSVIILDSNISATDLSNSSLQNVRISGDFSNTNLRESILHNADLSDASLGRADLTDAYLYDVILTDVNMILTNLQNSIFDCKSLESTNFTVNVSQAHIIEIINGMVREVASCQ